MSDNYLLLGINVIADIMKLKHLVGLNVSNQSTRLGIIPPKNGDAIVNNLYERKRIWSSFQRMTRRKKTPPCQTGMACPFVFPKNLKWVDTSHNALQVADVPELVFMRNTSLKYLNASYCGLRTIVYPLYCPWNIIPQVDTIDLSNNNLQCINASVFNKTVSGCDWNSLKCLNLGSNELHHIDGNVCSNSKNNVMGFLEPLTNLSVLDISDNKLASGHSLVSLEILTQLEALDLSSNRFHNFSLILNNLTKLVTLNLANNNLPCLSKSTMRQLDKMWNVKQIDMSGNLLSCNCDCYDFLKWMTLTDIQFENNQTYQCKFDDGKRITLNRLSYVISKLESHCYGVEWFEIYVGTGISVNLLIIICCVMYRMRHYL